MNKQIDEIFQQVLDEDCADPLLRFAELVAADEREACAKVCDYWLVGRDDICEVAKAIRARGRK
jgi:hypothetical protein